MTTFHVPVFGENSVEWLPIEIREPPPDTRTPFERFRDLVVAAIQERRRRVALAIRVLQGERFYDDDGYDE